MFNLGAPELLLIFLVVLLLFGGSKLPELARGLGKAIRNFKEEGRGHQTRRSKKLPRLLPPPHAEKKESSGAAGSKAELKLRLAHEVASHHRSDAVDLWGDAPASAGAQSGASVARPARGDENFQEIAL
jgi:TatA/E family protein of Tat protein translocase